jgi:hypothetical protein
MIDIFHDFESGIRVPTCSVRKRRSCLLCLRIHVSTQIHPDFELFLPNHAARMACLHNNNPQVLQRSTALYLLSDTHCHQRPNVNRTTLNMRSQLAIPFEPPRVVVTCVLSLARCRAYDLPRLSTKGGWQCPWALNK